MKLAGRQWHARLRRHLKTLGLKPATSEPCLYCDIKGEDIIVVVIYVDGIMIAYQNIHRIHEIQQGLATCSEVKNLGIPPYCIGIEINYCKEGITLSQILYIRFIKMIQNGGM